MLLFLSSFLLVFNPLIPGASGQSISTNKSGYHFVDIPDSTLQKDASTYQVVSPPSKDTTEPGKGDRPITPYINEIYADPNSGMEPFIAVTAADGTAIEDSLYCPDGTTLVMTGRMFYKDPACPDDTSEPQYETRQIFEHTCVIGGPIPPIPDIDIPSVEDLNLGTCPYLPLRRTRVELWEDNDWIPGPSYYDSLRVSTVSDGNGMFAFCRTSGGNDKANLYVSVKTCADGTTAGTACGMNPGGVPTPFSVVTTTTDNQVFTTTGSVAQDVCTGRIHWDIIDRRDMHIGGQKIFDVIANEAFDYLNDNAGWANELGLQVKYPDFGTGYTVSDKIVHVADNDAQDPDRILYAFSFSVLHSLYNYSFPSTTSACGTSTWGASSDSGCAWVKGAALFFQAAIQNDHIFEDTPAPGLPDDSPIDFEIPDPPVVSGEDQGAVAATLWDILDSAVEAWDTLNQPFDNVWQAIETQPDSICEFYAEYQKLFDTGTDLEAIIDHHNIDCCTIDLDIDKKPLAPGDTAIVTAITDAVSSDKPLEWDIITDDDSTADAVITADDDLGKTARITDVEGEGYVIIRVKNPSISGCEKEAKLYIGCECGEGSQNCKEKGTCFFELESVALHFSLGRTQLGFSAGEIFLEADVPDPANATPQILKVYSFGSEVEDIDEGNGLRQVIAPESFVDILVIDNYSYDMFFYDPADMGEKVGGIYQVQPGATPYVTWTVENPDASPTIFDRLRITEDKDGNIRVFEYIWNAAESQWDLSKGNGLQIISKKEEVVSDTRVVTETVKDGSGVIASKIETVYQTIVCSAESRDEIIETVVDPDGVALTTTNTWYENPGDIGNCGKIESQMNHDGSWVTYEYDSQGRNTKEVKSWLDAPFGSPESSVHAIYNDYAPQHASDSQAAEDDRLPRMITEAIMGNVDSKTYHIYIVDAGGSRSHIVERSLSPASGYGDLTNQRTVRKYFAHDPDAASSGRVQYIEYPDDRRDEFTYEFGTYTPNSDPALPGSFAPGAGKDIRETVVHGTIAQPSGIAFKTTMETSVTNSVGDLILQETYVYDGANYQPIQWQVQTHDTFGHVTMVSRSDGTLSESTWDCCGKSSDIDSRGITRFFDYDDLYRLNTETKDAADNIVTTHTYDAAGRRLTQMTTAGGLSQSSSFDYDGAGRLSETTDTAGLVTLYDYTAGGRITTMTRPGGATETTEQYVDGRVKSVTGTAVIPRYHSYGVNADGTQWTRIDTGSSSSPMWEKTTVDMLGRTIKVERPGFAGNEVTENFYDDKGRLIKTTTAGLADTLYTFDEIGNQILGGLDLDHNGSLDTNSTDRINETQTLYALLAGSWWQETEQKMYAEDSSSTANVTGIQRTRLSGLGPGGLASETVFIDIFGNQTVEQEFIDRTAKTETRIIDYPDSNIDGIIINENGLLISQQSKTGIGHIYDYDTLERRTGATDPRTGTSITHYNNKGQVDYVEDPALNRTQYTYDANSGRRMTETNPLGKVTRHAYNDRGQIIRTWGDTVYPVEYLYDDYGRMAEMHTWREGTNWNGEIWPSGMSGSADVTRWHYQEATGLLTSKEDHFGQSVSYTYGTSGKLATRTWARTDGANPLVTSFIYDNDTGELLGIEYSDSTPGIAFTYDRIGRQNTISDAVGTRTFSYNADLQVESETITGLYDQVITRTYETGAVLGRSTGFTLGTDYSVTYSYDDVGRFNSIVWNVAGNSDAADYTYLQNSDLIDQLTTNNGQWTTYDYEPNRNLRTRVRNEFDASLISQYDYQYDELGKRTSVINSGQAFDAVNSAFNLYDYNDRSEVIESARYLGNNIADTSNPVTSDYRSYEYDPIGNRLQLTEGTDTGTYTTNALNQYTIQNTPVGETNSFTYDLDGNLTEISNGTVTKEYLYNAENRLIAVQPKNPVDGDKKVEFTYDYMGRRVKKIVYVYESAVWVFESEKRFIYNGWNLIYELTSDGERSGDKYYIWGLDLSQTIQGAGGVGGLIASVEILAGDFNKDGDIDGSDLSELANNLAILDLSLFSSNFGNDSLSSSSGSSNYFYDGNGNVGQVVDVGSGENLAQYEYDPFGKAIYAAGAHADINPLNFSTKYFDSEVGLYYYIYRYYSPEIGRWLSKDPIGEIGGMNLFLFADNSAIFVVDFLGLSSGNCCGTEIGRTLKRLLAKTDKRLRKNRNERSICLGRFNIKEGWDIKELKEKKYPKYADAFDSGCCGKGDCNRTVSVDGDCYDKDGVNYALWGSIAKACGNSLGFATSVVEWYRSQAEKIQGIPADTETRNTWVRLGYWDKLKWNSRTDLVRSVPFFPTAPFPSGAMLNNAMEQQLHNKGIPSSNEVALKWDREANIAKIDCEPCLDDLGILKEYEGPLTARLKKLDGNFIEISSEE